MIQADDKTYEKLFVSSDAIFSEIDGIKPTLDNKQQILELLFSKVTTLKQNLPAFSKNLRDSLARKVPDFDLEEKLLVPCRRIYAVMAHMETIISSMETQTASQPLLSDNSKTSIIGAIGAKTQTELALILRQQGKELFHIIDSGLPGKLSNDKANSILANYDSNTQIVIFGKTYKATVSDTIVNPTFKPIYVNFLNSVGIKETAKFKVGDFTAAGHVGIVIPSEREQEVVGINTPLVNRIQYSLAAEPMEMQRAIDVKQWMQQSGHIDLALKFNANFKEDAKILLAFGFQFLVSMDYTYNSEILAKQEEAAIDKILKTTLNLTREKLYTDTVQRLKNAEVADRIYSKQRVNPTLEEYLKKLILYSIAGKPVKNITTSGTTKGKEISLNALGFKNKATLKSLSKSNVKAIAPSANKKVLSSSRPRLKPSILNLNTLMNLINTGLVQAIKANMGNGTRRDILNLRSGRFAESAKVEKISESRQGMITAFYSYMKNPYATFSTGGRQEFPKTRDPKLLISKSIRELATQQVANRLRAVSL